MTALRAGPGPALRMTLELAAPALDHAANHLWRPAGLARRYRAYLVAMHQIVRASVPLMELAARRSDGPLRAYLAEHVEEERHHDDWLLADLAAAGGDPGLVNAAAPPLAVARLVGAQYYWIEHWHPPCLLGYIAALEGNAPAPALADHLAAAAGLPPAAFRTLRHHADVDTGHSDAVFDLLDRLPLSAPQARAVTVNALSTVTALTDLFDHLGAVT